MPKTFLLLLLLVFYRTAFAQTPKECTISFGPSKTVTRSRSEVIIPIHYTGLVKPNFDASRYIVEVFVLRSNLVQSEFRLDNTVRPLGSIDFRDSTRNTVYLLLAGDSTADKPRTITLSMRIRQSEHPDSIVYNPGIDTIQLQLAARPTTGKPAVIPAHATHSIGFINPGELKRSSTQDVIYKLLLTASYADVKNPGDYKVRISADKDSSTLPVIHYGIGPVELPLSSLSQSDTSQNVVYITLKKEDSADRSQRLVLNLQLFRNGDSVPRQLNSKTPRITLTIAPHVITTPLNQYNYLGYVGTNFDLVDGIKAQNLFFATNIFLPPVQKKTIGFYVSLYGNRTMSISDSTPGVLKTTQVLRQSNSDTSLLISKQMSLIRFMQSDNLGAYCSPLFRLWSLSSNSSNLKLYFAPSLEFVWRRTHVSYSYSSPVRTDTSIKTDPGLQNYDYPLSYSNNFHEYAFNTGAGLMLVHESNSISMRLHTSIGYNITYSPLQPSSVSGGPTESLLAPVRSNYDHTKDLFFTGRLWITEARTGLTLQAEVTNTSKRPRPFYGVTLSKAIDFRDLGNIFKPITSR